MRDRKKEDGMDNPEEYREHLRNNKESRRRKRQWKRVLRKGERRRLAGCTCDEPAKPWAWGDLQGLGCSVHDEVEA